MNTEPKQIEQLQAETLQAVKDAGVNAEVVEFIAREFEQLQQFRGSLAFMANR